MVRGKEPVEDALWSQVHWNPWELGEAGIWHKELVTDWHLEQGLDGMG